jgi:quinone-modifying oxidoreductase subunit QmoC
MPAITQTIKFDSERDRAFPGEIQKEPGGEKLEHCIQCGTCSGVCPLSIYMDYTPRRVIYLTRAGFKDEVLKSNTIWLCSSCYACTVDCPKGIHITDIMYTLKQRAIRDNLYPRGFPIPVLAREFFKMVRSSGRVSESWLVIRLLIHTNILKLFGMWRLGLDLVRTGRFSLKQESIPQTRELRKMLDAARGS